MAESLFDIFGDHITRQAMKNVSRQPLCNIENMGKTASSGPIKPNEPVKKLGEVKKSFLSNTGKALQSTPARQVFSPRTVNVSALIYTDSEDNGKTCTYEDLEFTRPFCKYDNYNRDLFDYLPLPEVDVAKHISPPCTPQPEIRRHSLDLECSYQDEFFTDDFSCGSIPDDDLGLPKIY
ncbi:uncharacterized protein [Battus philenor]|uniref:uncharacterized protein n=1 Tax=Battus philenor TaxID=42288 RepID=UPI0035D04CD2